MYEVAPATYQATTSVLLTYGPYEDGSTAAADEQTIAESSAVAGLAVRDLRLPESPASFAANYTVADVSPRVLTITYSASSSREAVILANAAAKAFLQFRVHQLQASQQLVIAALAEQTRQTRQHINTIGTQIGYWRTQPGSAAQRAKLSGLQTELGDAKSELFTLQQSADNAQASSATVLAERGSQVLNPAAGVHRSRLKPLISRAVIGLVAGFAVGLAIVMVRALLSDRLRRREDVAHALGAPVKLSVGVVRLSRWFPGRRGLEAARGANIRRIVAHLSGNVRPNSRGMAALAIVPVDELQVAAVSVASLALSCAQQGQQVIVADLCPGAPAARLLADAKPGVRGVRAQGAHLVLAVPDRDEMLPIGPLELTAPPGQQPSFTGAVTAACASADLLLTMVALDPSLGSEHLATWASDVVAIVTAGTSSATRLHGVGEMIRLAGTPLASVVLIGVDKTDESLGLAYPTRTHPHARAARG